MMVYLLLWQRRRAMLLCYPVIKKKKIAAVLWTVCIFAGWQPLDIHAEVLEVD